MLLRLIIAGYCRHRNEAQTKRMNRSGHCNKFLRWVHSSQIKIMFTISSLRWQSLECSSSTDCGLGRRIYIIENSFLEGGPPSSFESFIYDDYHVFCHMSN